MCIILDSFQEQLVIIKNTSKVTFLKVLIWVCTAIFAAIALFLTPKFPPALLVCAGALYLAFKSTSQFNIEYEYISTNGSVDVDKIINKTTRKNVISFECKEVEKVVKYDSNLIYKNKLLICTDKFDEAYVFTVSSKGIKYDLVFSPNAKLLDSFKHYIPRSVIAKR